MIEDNNGVHFNSDKHEYTNSNNEKYISCSTIVGLYEEEFKMEYQLWCSALKEIDIDYKKNKQLYRALLMEDWIKSVIPNYINLEKLLAKREELKKKWKKTNVEACEEGTRIHNAKEHNALITKKAIVNNKEYNVLDWQEFVENKKYINYYECLPDGYYTELRLWNHDFKIAGTSDVVLIETNEIGERTIIILDFKSNSKFTHYSVFNKYMLSPLDHLQDCHKNIYTIQLSLYAYLLEEMGFKIKNILITHIDKITNVHTHIPLDYRRQDVINMIQHYHSNKHITTEMKELEEYNKEKRKYVAMVGDGEDYENVHLFDVVRKYFKIK